MNLAIRGIDGDLGGEPADSFHRDQRKDLKADYILANPPFNMSDWRGDEGAGKYEDIAGFCKSAKLDESRAHGFVFTPGRYVGAEEAAEDGEPFEQKMKRLTATLEEQFAESAKLEKTIRRDLAALNFP